MNPTRRWRAGVLASRVYAAFAEGGWGRRVARPGGGGAAGRGWGVGDLIELQSLALKGTNVIASGGSRRQHRAYLRP